MPGKQKIILIGCGGHCAACLDVLELEGRFSPVALVDQSANLGTCVCGRRVEYTDADLPGLIAEFENALISVGQITSAAVRTALFERVIKLGGKCPVVVSPLAYVSGQAALSDGSIVMHQALVNAGARIGRNVIINTKALIEHHTEIGDHCHVSTSAVVNGGCRVGAACFIGSNAVLREGVSVGDGCVIGCASVVLADVPPGRKVTGVWKGV